ncbi:hypothetical protein ACFVUH_02520 [Kitasatospora sp. NPDC058032]|uniref:hypothetical protein n=1 Tax=unclassified Kitasatospora TaxID=2633591 RepID=UPI0033BA1982
MSRIAQVIVLATYADEAMEPLTREDSPDWRFKPLDLFAGGWVIEFHGMRPRTGLLRRLESLAWPHPESVQVLIHDEEDDCYGLWMMRDGVLTEVPVPGHRRYYGPAPTGDDPPSPGSLWRPDTAATAVAGWARTTPQDPRPAW